MSQKIFKNCLDLEALESSYIISRESYLTEKYIFLKKKMKIYYLIQCLNYKCIFT